REFALEALHLGLQRLVCLQPFVRPWAGPRGTRGHGGLLSSDLHPNLRPPRQREHRAPVRVLAAPFVQVASVVSTDPRDASRRLSLGFGGMPVSLADRLWGH